MTLKSYRLIDLVILTVIGCIIEGVLIYGMGYLFPIAPHVVTGILIVTIGIARWGLPGIAPGVFLSLITVAVGHFQIETTQWSKAYNVYSFIALLSAYASMLALVPLFKKMTTKYIFGNNYRIISVYLFGFLLFALVYCFVMTIEAAIVDKTFVLSGVIASFFKSNYVALIVSFIFTIPLKAQGVFVNVKQNLIDKQKEAEAERLYYSKTQTTEDESSDEEKGA